MIVHFSDSKVVWKVIDWFLKQSLRAPKNAYDLRRRYNSAVFHCHNETISAPIALAEPEAMEKVGKSLRNIKGVVVGELQIIRNAYIFCRIGQNNYVHSTRCCATRCANCYSSKGGRVNLTWNEKTRQPIRRSPIF